MSDDDFDPTDSDAFRAAFGQWTLSLVDKGATVDKQHVSLFKFAFTAGFRYGES